MFYYIIIYFTVTSEVIVTMNYLFTLHNTHDITCDY